MTSTHGALHIDWGLPQDFRIHTERMDLVPAGPDLVDTDWGDHARLSQLLGARVPDRWPPDLVADRNSADGAGWWDWYVVKRGGDAPILIGVMGLKGWPAVSRSLQLGCAFLPAFHGQGYGTEAVQALTSWALAQTRIQQVLAEVPADNSASAAVLRKLGFVELNRGEDDGFLQFEKR